MVVTRSLLLLALGVGLAAQLSCAGPAQRAQPPSAQWPALPAGAIDQRAPSAIQTSHLNGADALQFSAGAQVQGSALALDAPAGPPRFEWALWRYTPAPGATPQSVAFDFAIESGASAWIGVADYADNIWQLAGPYPSAGTAVIGSLSATNISPGGNVFLLVGAYSGTALLVSGLDLEVDVPVQLKYFIGGRLRHATLNYYIDGEVMTLQPGDVQATTAGGGYYNFPDLTPGEYTIIPPVLDGVEISPPQSVVTLVDANVTDVHFTATPPGEQITYKTHIKFLFDAKCMACHDEDTSQFGNGVRLDMYLRPDSNDAWHHAESAYERTSTGDSPPPGPPLNASEKQLIDTWIDEGKVE